MFFITRKHDKNGKVVEETVENFVLDKKVAPDLETLDITPGQLYAVEDIDLAEKVLGKYSQPAFVDELAAMTSETWDNLLRVKAQCDYAYGNCFTCAKKIEAGLSRRSYRKLCWKCDGYLEAVKMPENSSVVMVSLSTFRGVPVGRCEAILQEQEEE